MGYPTSVTIEHIITLFIVTISLIVLFKKLFGIKGAIFAALLWLPFLNTLEPPVQKLGLAFLCFGVALRDSKYESKIYYSYILFIIAYLFRSVYLLPLFIFAVWDMIKLLQKGNLLKKLSKFRFKYKYILLFLILGVIFWFGVNQSSSPFNNIFTSTSTWIPGNDKSLFEGAFIQNYNEHYIINNNLPYEDIDFYFTNKELFNGETSVKGAILANPTFVIKQVIINIKDFMLNVASLTILLPLSLPSSPYFSGIPKIIIIILATFMTLSIIYGSFKATERKDNLRLMVIGLLFPVAVYLTIRIQLRDLVLLIPIMILCAFWYATKLYSFSKNKFKKINMLFYLMIFLIIFSLGVYMWGMLGKDIINDIQNRDFNILEIQHKDAPTSMKASYDNIRPLIKDCKGIISLEHTFVGAFMDIPINRVYDIWEIPPFGNLNHSDYKGLNPSRIDCILMSNELMKATAFSTNPKIRYNNYIKPYFLKLVDDGAKVYKIDHYGYVLILNTKDQN
jgi:hypothetical protein